MKPEPNRRDARGVRHRAREVHRGPGWWRNQKATRRFDLWSGPLNPLTSAHEDAQREVWQAIDAVVDEVVQVLGGRRSERWWS